MALAKEAIKAAEAAAYESGVEETKAKLVVEVKLVCRDYFAETYYETLDRVRVPADSDLRRADKVFYPEDIRENPTALPLPAAFPLPPPEQPLTTQTPSQRIETPIGAQKGKKG